jgi:predicted translin family RNA/ssDNA-binding protein
MMEFGTTRVTNYRGFSEEDREMLMVAIQEYSGELDGRVEEAKKAYDKRKAYVESLMDGLAKLKEGYQEAQNLRDEYEDELKVYEDMYEKYWEMTDNDPEMGGLLQKMTRTRAKISKMFLGWKKKL